MNVPIYVVQKNKQPHPRIIIREWVKELLKANTDLGGRWFTSRPDPRFLDETPCGLVYYTDEPANAQNTVPRLYKRTLSLTIEVLYRADSERENELDDWLDSRAFEIETAMLSDRYMGLKDYLGDQNFIEDVVLTRTEPVSITGEGNTECGSVRLFFDIRYVTLSTYGGTLDEFLTFLNEIETVDGQEATDDVTIRTE